MVTRRELELELIERYRKASHHALHETYNLDDIATHITQDEALLLGIDTTNPPPFFGHPIIIDT